jgi:hypothetical protein
MDIFTTQLTRVVNLPIKPVKLKVKAPTKEAASAKLNEDPDHLENHNTYLSDDEHYYIDAQSVKAPQRELFANANANADSTSTIANKPQKNADGTASKKDNKVTKHLDLYA